MRSLILAVALVELLCGGIAGTVSYLAWQHRERPAAVPMFVLTGAGFVYATTTAFASIVPGDPLTRAFGIARYPVGTLISVGVFYTAVEYTDRTRFQQSDVLGVVGGFLLADIVLFATNFRHSWLLSVGVTETGLYQGKATPIYYLVHLFPDFLFVSFGLGFLLFEYAARETHRKETGAVFAGIAVSFAFFVIENAVPVHDAFNIAVIGISIGSVILLWAFFYADLLETVPIARKTLMEHMDAAVIAVDTDGRVIDVNDTATELLELDDPVGSHATEVFSSYPDLVERFEHTFETEDELSLTVDGETKYYSVNISPIEQDVAYGSSHDRTETIGRLIVARDITERRLQEQERDFLKQVFARVLRHNIRNDLNVIKGNAQLLAEQAVDADQDIIETLEECTDDVIDLSTKARELESVIDSSQTKRTVLLSRAVENAVSAVTETYPDADITVSIEPCHVRAHQSLEVAIENLIENACEHTATSTPTVTVTTRLNDETVRILVEDDGPGIPEHELSVLESERESALQHGSGLGLWLVKWIADRSDATIDIETGSEGTTITLELTRATERKATESAASVD